MMDIKEIDGELYLKKETKVFLDTDKIPELDPAKYSIVIIKTKSGKEA